MSEPGRAWLIGEAPTRANGEPFTGKSGDMLRRMAGIDDLSKHFILTNVLDAWPGKSRGKGAKFPKAQAREGVQKLLKRIRRYDLVIIVGGRNAKDAWRMLEKRPYVWHPMSHALNTEHPIGLMITPIAWIPHPSPINQHWNNPTNVEQLRRFMQDVIDNVPIPEGEGAGLGIHAKGHGQPGEEADAFVPPEAGVISSR